MSKVRTERINAEIMRTLSDIIAHRLKDPAITGMVSITRVATAQDLKHAKVWVSIFGTDNPLESFNALQRSASFLRREIASALKTMRTVPELHFVYDDSAEYSAHINELINKIKQD